MSQTDRPNVLIIYPDQMRYDAMGCAGNPHIRTPNIDRLAEEGVLFEHAYTSFPLCCPFRASVMTGKYAHSNGMYANHYPVPLGQTFLAEQFKAAGYRTGYIGKWHLDGGIKHGYVPPERRLGFDWFVGFNRGHEYFGSIFYRNNDPTPRTSRRYEPEFQTDHLIEFMQTCLDAPGRPPFLAMICYGLPHPPLIMPERYASMYDPADVPVRENTPEGDRQRAAEFIAKYYGLTTSVDDNLGRLLSWLDETGVAQNTIVYFVSDHGEMAREHGRGGKKVYHEASMRVPLIVRWPAKLEPGRRVTELVDGAVDTMPTLLDLCGQRIPGQVQGVSFAPLLLGEDKPVRDAIYYEILMEEEGPERFPVAERGVRTQDWVYVRTQEKPTVLFDVCSDPLELENRVAAPECAATIEKLDAKLSEHMAATDDSWDIHAKFPPPDFQIHEQGKEHLRTLLDQAVVEC
jgi:arylsulfatase A-like enzyme